MNRSFLRDPKRIAVLRVEPSEDSFYAELEPAPDPSPWLLGHEVRIFDLHVRSVQRVLKEVRAWAPEFVVNLCDGCHDEDRPGMDVVLGLRSLGLAFTGASQHCYDIHRDAQKIAAHSAGARIPNYCVVRDEEGIRAAAEIGFPLLIKPPQGYNSVGITRESKVLDEEALLERSRAVLEEYGAVLIEEFIEGRECTVLVSEGLQDARSPYAYVPLEFLFPEGETFKHFALKWEDYQEMESQVVQDLGLAARLREVASDTFVSLGHDGYARIDFRVDSDGEIFFLEINSNPSIFYPEGEYGSADFILSKDEVGFEGFLERILQAAKRRQERDARGYDFSFSAKDGFGVIARRAFSPGEVVFREEETSFRLVSLKHVKNTWPKEMQKWFFDYAFPVHENVYIMWDEDPNRWKPINHSCDPNVALDGLNEIATREIRPGEPLTIDYRTFCGPLSSSFVCNCRAPNCRGEIRDFRGMGFTAGGPRVPGAESQIHPASPQREDGRAAYEVRAIESPLGVGLYALRDWAPGETLTQFAWGPEFLEPSRWTVQVALGVHVETSPHETRYINHSCDPNVFFDVETREIVALKSIRVDEALTFFYPSTEWDMDEHFDCVCRQPVCRGRISGARSLSPEVLQSYRINPHVLEARRREGLEVAPGGEV